MTITERRERHRQQLRQEILDAAREILVTKGYAGLSMRKVAERIDYSPTAIYLHFADKQDLVFHLCEETFARLVRDLEHLDTEIADPLARLREGLRRYVDFGLRNPQHYTATFLVPHEPTADAARLAAYTDPSSMGMRALGILSTSLRAAIKARTIRRVDVQETTLALWSAIHGLTSLLIAMPDFPWGHRDHLIAHTITVMLDGLKRTR